MAIKLFLPGRFDRLAIVFYLAIGWSGVVVIGRCSRRLPPASIGLILAGGIVYSAGVVFFVWRGPALPERRLARFRRHRRRPASAPQSVDCHGRQRASEMPNLAAKRLSKPSASSNFVIIPLRVARHCIAGQRIRGDEWAFFRSFGLVGSSDVMELRSRTSYPSPQVFVLSMLVFLAIVAFIAAILTRQISVRLHHQSRPQRPDPRRVRWSASCCAFQQIVPAVPRSALGQLLPRRLRGHRTGAAGADEGAAVAARRRMALSTASMRTDARSRSPPASTKAATSRATSSACWSSSACSAPSGACSTPSARSATPSSRSIPAPATAARCARRAEGRSCRTARRHGHRLLVLAVRPFRLAGARLPRPAGRPRADALLHRAGELAVLGHRPVLRHRRRRWRSKGGSSDEIRALSERLRSLQENGGGSNPRVATAMANLADGISGLVKNMRTEQQMMRDWVEAQSEEQKAMRRTLETTGRRAEEAGSCN